MNIMPRTDGNVLKFYNIDNGSIQYKTSNDVIRTYNLKTGSLIRSISM